MPLGGRYIADFAVPAVRVVVEVDGGLVAPPRCSPLHGSPCSLALRAARALSSRL
ncbi:MAG: hypothetical protein KF718_06260 [Polyangiaceae bacterium]|nr:hypothetical protein [Polyangiaceae bacterium]